jgi:phosphofructokinase-like protein
MPKPIRRIAILTSGGDAPGLNAVIRSVVKTAVVRHRWEVVGILDGFEGLIGPPRTRPLTLDDVAGLLPRGGSILGCTNRGHLWSDAHSGYRGALDSVAAAIQTTEVDALVMVGGDGSHRIANELVGLGVPLVGVPKTIDNDLAGTENTFGFDSAVTFATEAIDRLHTTAESHGRVMVVEVMGREAGWIALYAGIAGGADVILIPEIPYVLERASKHIAARAASGKSFSIVVVAEGAIAAGTRGHGAEADDCPGGGRAGTRGRMPGIGSRVASDLELSTGKETRAVVLGHLQRGGSPTATDRLLASAYGSVAVHAIAEGHLGQMVTWRGGAIQLVPISECVAHPRTVPTTHPLLDTATGLGITFAGEEDRHLP